MSLGIDRAVCWLSGFCFTIGMVALSAIGIVQAQESVPPAPPACTRCDQDCCPTALGIDPVAAEFFQRATRALASEFGSGMMFRVAMPRPELFAEHPCSGEKCEQEQIARLGEGRVEFEQSPPAFTAKFLRLGCPCAASGECTCASKTDCGTDCAVSSQAACKCCPCSGESHDVKHEAKCGDERCELSNVIVKHFRHAEESIPSPHKLMQQIATLMAEKSAAQAALAVRQEADEQIGEIYEAMAELLADNAALDAKLEAQAEHRKLAEKIADLAAENTRLKSQVELAAARAEMAQAANALALENEKLKLRLVEVEQKQSLADAARTATNPRSERKQR